MPGPVLAASVTLAKQVGADGLSLELRGASTSLSAEPVHAAVDGSGTFIPDALKYGWSHREYTARIEEDRQFLAQSKGQKYKPKVLLPDVVKEYCPAIFRRPSLDNPGLSGFMRRAAQAGPNMRDFRSMVLTVPFFTGVAAAGTGLFSVLLGLPADFSTALAAGFVFLTTSAIATSVNAIFLLKDLVWKHEYRERSLLVNSLLANPDFIVNLATEHPELLRELCADYLKNQAVGIKHDLERQARTPQADLIRTKADIAKAEKNQFLQNKEGILAGLRQREEQYERFLEPLRQLIAHFADVIEHPQVHLHALDKLIQEATAYKEALELQSEYGSGDTADAPIDISRMADALSAAQDLFASLDIPEDLRRTLKRRGKTDLELAGLG